MISSSQVKEQSIPIYTKGLAPVPGINRKWGIPNNLVLPNGLPMISFGGSAGSAPEFNPSNSFYAGLESSVEATTALSEIISGFPANYAPYLSKAIESKLTYLWGTASDVAATVEVLLDLASEGENSSQRAELVKEASKGVYFLTQVKAKIVEIYGQAGSPEISKLDKFIMNAVKKTTQLDPNVALPAGIQPAQDIQKVYLWLAVGVAIVLVAAVANAKSRRYA